MREENEKQPLYFRVTGKEYLKLINYQKQYKDGKQVCSGYESEAE